MRTSTKLFLLSVSVMAVPYANHRFHSSRYAPQCDHLPGICVYGRQESMWGSVRVYKNDDSVGRGLNICNEGRCFNITGIYSNQQSSLVKLLFGDLYHDNTKTCEVSEPVQVLIDGQDLIVKGCNSSLDEYGFYAAALASLKDAIETPKPLVLDCKRDVPRRELPKYCDSQPQKKTKTKQPPPAVFSPVEKAGCDVARRLIESESKNNQNCIVSKQADALLYELDERRYIAEQTANSEAVLYDLSHPAPSSSTPESKWDNWDWMFWGGILGAMGLKILMAFKKKTGKRHDAATRSGTASPTSQEQRVAHSKADQFATRGAPGPYRYTSPIGTAAKGRASDLVRDGHIGEMRRARPRPQKTGDEMDEKESKRKELKKLYDKTMEELFRKVEKATTREECRIIREDFRILRDKLLTEDAELYKSLRQEDLRFQNALGWKIESLGGPKASLWCR